MPCDQAEVQYDSELCKYLCQFTWKTEFMKNYFFIHVTENEMK